MNALTRRRFLRALGALVLFCLLAAQTAGADQVTIRVLHVNDFHGVAEPTRSRSGEQIGGIAWLSSRVNELRRGHPSLLLAAGDMISGSTWTNLFQGRPVIELMNEMKFDAMVVGNHEFDFGASVLKQRITEAGFPVLAANVSGLEGLARFAVCEVNGIRVGIIGVVTEETPIVTSARNVAGLSFLSAEAAVRELLGQLRDKTDFVIVLSHLGHAEDRALAQRIRGPLLIVGGHSHTRVQEPVTVNGNVVVQAWEYAKALGVVDIVFEDRKVVSIRGRIEEISPQAEPDPAVERIVSKYAKLVDDELNTELGETEVWLDGLHVRSGETNLGNLIADIVRSAAGADAAIIAAGSVRASIPKGAVTKKQVSAVAPFDSRVVAIKMSGRQVRAALEHGLSFFGEASAKFPQVSGIRFAYRKSADGSARVETLVIGRSAVEDDREYIVATDDFLASGGDGYTVFREAAAGREGIVYQGSAWVRDVVSEYIKSMQRVSPEVEGRSVRIE